MTNPFFGIIVPTYNAIKTLQRAADSVFSQKFSAWQMILIDDGSYDESGCVCDEYSVSDSRVICVHHGTNAGVPAARNTGLDTIPTSAEYIAFLDSDDEIVNNAFTDMSVIAQNSKSDIVVGNMTVYDISTNEWKEYELPAFRDNTIKKEEITSRYIAPFYSLIPSKECCLCKWSLQSAIYNAGFIMKNKLRFLVRQLFGEDAKFMLESLCRAESLTETNIVFHKYYYDSSSVSRKYIYKYSQSTIEAIKYRKKLLIENKFDKTWNDSIVGAAWVGIVSYLVGALNRSCPKSEMRSFIYSNEIRSILIESLFMNSERMYRAQISRKYKIAAVLLLLGYYGMAIKLIT